MNSIELKRLGDQYEEKGDYDSAEMLFRTALTIQEKQLGEEHPSLAVDLYNLGLLCYAMRKFSESETLLMRAWAIERDCYGPMHPETLATLEALSEVYYDANRNVEMEYSGVLSASQRPSGASPVHVYH